MISKDFFAVSKVPVKPIFEQLMDNAILQFLRGQPSPKVRHQHNGELF